MPEANETETQQLESAEAPAQQEERSIAVEFKHVSKSYKLYRNDRMRALGIFSKRVPYKTVYANDDLSFKIYQGQSVAFLGSNGAGKSTALKMITGVKYPTEGEVIVNGTVSALLELRAGFDNALTGRENIHLRGKIQGMTEEQIKELEPRVVKFAALGDYIDQPLRTYSSGMKARLGFAFASSVRPDILVCDEALSVGDRRFAKKCNRRIRRLIRNKKTTVILVTHNSTAARRLCDYGIVMENGRKVFEGPIEDAIAFYEREDDEDDPDA